jgi:hypothetical protein
MRRVIVCNIMSLDGFCEGPGDDVMVLPMDDAFDATDIEAGRLSSRDAAATIVATVQAAFTAPGEAVPLSRGTRGR